MALERVANEACTGRSMNIRFVVGALLISGCLELSLPQPPPPPGPGTVQGTLKYSVPGRSGVLPAKTGRVVLLGTANEARADDEGRFTLSGVTESTGSLRFYADLDGDGAIDRQRVMTLESIGAGPGRDVALGELVLGRNARLSGRVLRGDLTQDAFHLGSTVFVTGMEYSTFSADNGAWVLDALPEGPLQVAFVRSGYLPETREVVLEAGEEKRLTDVRLVASPSAAATASGKVVSASGPVAQARVRAVSSDGSAVATTGDDGAFKLGPVPAGAWVIGVEAQGFKSVSLGKQLLNPGSNELRPITLVAGVSTMLDLDAGVAPPLLDGGVDAGVLDAGSEPEKDAGAGGGAAGGSAAGGGSAGGSAGGVGGGVAGGGVAGGSGGAPDAGPPLDCAGACSTGFFCSPSVQCQTASCGLTSCAGSCNDGRCYASSCGATTCGPGEVCDGVVCKPLACAGVACASGSLCANGRCVSQLCRFGTCQPGTVCIGSDCVDTRCVDVLCAPQHSCIGGVCLPTSNQTGGACSPGFVFLGGRCVDQACQGVTCPAGALCRNGQCNSTGLYAAGLTYAEGRSSSTPETIIATLTPAGWRRLNITALPQVLQLAASPDGQWLFALTDDVVGGEKEGSLWRSADGVGWVRVFDGTQPGTSGAFSSIAWHVPTSTLYASINGAVSNTLSGALASSDNGATWRRVYNATQHAAGRDRSASVSPALTAVPFSNLSTNGLFPNDGGTKLPFFSQYQTHLLSDPLDQRATIISAGGDVRRLDGGALAPITAACKDCVVWGPGQAVFVNSASALWFSPNDGVSWGLLPFPITAPLALTSFVRGSDDSLVVGNLNAQPPLLSSPDEGQTWSQLGADWFADPQLGDPVPAWQPDASYTFQQRVRPTVPNGWIFERFYGNAPNSGRVEPTWSTDGGDVNDPNVSMGWRAVGRHLGMRVTALASLRCSSGQQQCGGACVNVASSPAHCGGCGLTCAGMCVNGSCQVVDSGAGPQAGCADGTREGFIDHVAWPDIAACRGSWSGDLSASADAVCGAGFHVCTNTDTELTTVGTNDALAFPGCFAYRASNDGFDGCEPLECQGNPARDDMAGMGRGCLLLSGVSRAPATIPDGGTSCLADRGRIDAQCCAMSVSVPGSSRSPGCAQRAEDGVVCCRN